MRIKSKQQAYQLLVTGELGQVKTKPGSFGVQSINEWSMGSQNKEKMQIRYKQQMYQLLAAGKLGNTIPQYFSYTDWIQTQPDVPSWWGIRSLIPGGPCHLNIHAYNVQRLVSRYQPGTYNISEMIDQTNVVTAWMEISYQPELTVYIMEYPERGTSWRVRMPYEGREYTGSIAMKLLRKHLNSNSFADVTELLDTYSDHVVELSACENCLGTIPHRNHVIWEVRDY